jgi:hypothetical protein
VANLSVTALPKFIFPFLLLEQHYKNHCKPDETEADDEGPPLVFVNNETGEIMDCAGNLYPPPPGYVSNTHHPRQIRPQAPLQLAAPVKKKKTKRR